MLYKQGESVYMQNQEELDILYKLKKEVEKSDHHTFVQTINQMIKKVYLNQYTVTFVGHFSSGKSTVINRLIGQEILPSSPVPTTSNTARVTVTEQSGMTANIEGQKYTSLQNYDEVKAMNRENYQVESIDIQIQTSKFKNGFTFQDTPGVDSNVQSHSAQTEQFLYTSNIVFYTVDYNHVQSALNFKFMKRLNYAGIPVVFVVNQIDKHNRQEIDFETFQRRVQQSIQEWDIQLLKTFYITKFEHPYNEFDALSLFIQEQDQHREPVKDYVARMKDFIQQHQTDYLQQEMQLLLERLNITPEQFDQAYQTHQKNEMISEEAQLLNTPSALKQYLKDKRRSIIDNAYIMTHDMRETIRFYLESMTKNFKAGGLFNKKRKTEEIRSTRLNDVMQQLQKRIAHQIEKPMQDDLSFLTRFINNTQLNQQILKQHFEIPESLITELYQTQIEITNQYVLTFSEHLMKEIKQYILKMSEPLDEEIIANVHAEEHLVEDSTDIQDYKRYIDLRKLKQSLETENYRHYYIHMSDSLDQLIDRTRIHFQPQKNVSGLTNETDNYQGAITNERTLHTTQIQQGLDIVRNIPLFKSSVKNIEDTLTRMTQQKIKIGVFGTFSAGKSSLINALLGKAYLTSSPNPTTAATTEISYGSHHSVTFKTPDALLADINNMTQLMDDQFDSIASFLNTNLEQLKTKIDKNSLAFINAVEKNYDLYQSYIEKGIEHPIDASEISKWSAEDEFATFVQMVHLRIPIPWLKDKVIIDSLGLHSNNQRHTNETEKILTTSDLILYVSYFNHAFTQNDQAFIQHMKDMNQLKANQSFKMVINAVDLAENNDDQQAVYAYVKDALSKVQMNPDILMVSSRTALETGDEGIHTLKESITHFAEVDSKSLLEQKMYDQFAYIKEAYETIISDFETNTQQLHQTKQQLEHMRREKLFKTELIQSIAQKTFNEIEDQIYHLNERLKIQLADDVKAIYNGQMTNTNHFNEEKRRSTKSYLDQIHQKLFLEQTLLIERIKHFFNQALQQEMAPKIKILQQYRIIIPDYETIQIEPYEKSILTLELQQMVNQLPKQLTKRNLLQPKVQKQIQSEIKVHTINLLQPKLTELRKVLESLLDQLTSKATEAIETAELEAQNEINAILDFKIDDELIDQLKISTPKLAQILNLKD